MRLRSARLAALLTLPAATAAGAQAPDLSATFSSILQTYQLSGCGAPGSPTLDRGFPCVTGTATYGLLNAGVTYPTQRAGYGIRFDVAADFRNPPQRVGAPLDRVFLGPSSYFVASLAVPRADCFPWAPYVDGLCTRQSVHLGTPLTSIAALAGQTVTTALTITDALLVSAVPVDPARFRLDGVRLDYDYWLQEVGGFGGTFYVTPAVTLTPEPASVALTASGLAAVGAAARRRRRSR